MKEKDLDTINKVEIVKPPKEIDWGLKAIKAPQVWSKTKGEGVKILLIDTGIDDNHEQLKHAFKLGYNFFERSNDVHDEVGHGTHVAGLLVGGTTGVAPKAELTVVKVLNNDGRGSYGSVMDGITYAINFGFDIVCMSLGVNNKLPLMMQERFAQAHQKGITMVCATGNQGDNEALNPARLDEVIAVGGLNEQMEVASFTNGGYDVLAPAINILSTYKDGQYAKMTGTSMASPLVAGGIALLISYYRKQGKELTPNEIKSMLSGNLDLTELIK